ncbi:MAG: hypothetical protein CNCCGFBP_01569 [Fimbriimonadaceae bacterium]|nr:hypothetical protein [Fimbriimonadaceae bacterium]
MKLPKAVQSPWFGALAATLVVGGFIVVQHLTHGWPFSLHHGLPPAGGGSEAAPPGAAPPIDPHAAHVRVPIELADAVSARSGVVVEKVRSEDISRPLRAVATIAPDEARVSHVHTRVSGWIEQLHINTTGQAVKAGDPLAGIFSQELLASQIEYLAALKASAGGPTSAIVEGARSRLKVLGMGDAQIRAIEKSGTPRRLVTVTAPRDGIVLHRGITVGTAVDPSTELMTIVDLSEVWALAEVPGSDAERVAVGVRATIEIPNSGAPPFESSVAFVYPTFSERTRTLKVRFVVPNPDGKLKPGLYGTIAFDLAPRVALTVPRDAVVDTGQRQHVFVVEHPGHYVPRTVELGTTLADRVEIIQGLTAGESVVASGVFLIDSESRLRASGGGTGHQHGGAGQGESDKAPAANTMDSDGSTDAPAPDVNPHAGHGAP